MRTPDSSPRPSSPFHEALLGVVAELRGTAPETRAILAGLILVLGAWVGPGLPDVVPSPVALSGAPGNAPQVVGVQEVDDEGRAYEDAVGSTLAEEAHKGELKARTTDEDQD